MLQLYEKWINAFFFFWMEIIVLSVGRKLFCVIDKSTKNTFLYSWGVSDSKALYLIWRASCHSTASLFKVTIIHLPDVSMLKFPLFRSSCRRCCWATLPTLRWSWCWSCSLCPSSWTWVALAQSHDFMLLTSLIRSDFSLLSLAPLPPSPSCSGWWTAWWWGSTRRRRAWTTPATARWRRPTRCPGWTVRSHGWE